MADALGNQADKRTSFQTQTLYLIRDCFIALGIESEFSVTFEETKQILGASATTSRGASMTITASDLQNFEKCYSRC
eukprot:jgi/Bigna1/90592/estExt_fgenesh1_pg.C_740011